MECMFGVEELEEMMGFICLELMNYKNFLTILLFVSNVCFAEPLSVRTNNAGNLVYSKHNNWDGQIGKYKRFAKFKDKESGLNAMQSVIESNIVKTKTVEKFVARYVNESNNLKHIKRYENAIIKHIGREHLYKGDSEKLMPLIVLLEGGSQSYLYFYGEYNVRTNRHGNFDKFVQTTFIKNGLHRRTIKQVECYSLRDVLIST